MARTTTRTATNNSSTRSTRTRTTKPKEEKAVGTVNATVTEVPVPKGYTVSELLKSASVQPWKEANSGNGFVTQVTFVRKDTGKKLWISFWKEEKDSAEFRPMTGSSYDTKTQKRAKHENLNNRLSGSSWFGQKGREWWTVHDSLLQMATELVRAHA